MRARAGEEPAVARGEDPRRRRSRASRPARRKSSWKSRNSGWRYCVSGIVGRRSRSSRAVASPRCRRHSARNIARNASASARGDDAAPSTASTSAQHACWAAREHGVEERAAGVGVDLDQLRAVAAEVEVVAEKDAARAEVVVRDRRRQAATQSREGRRGDHLVDRGDHRLHVLELRAGEEDRRRREEMRPLAQDRVVDAHRERARLERAAKLRGVDGDAVAAAVQRSRRASAPRRFALTVQIDARAIRRRAASGAPTVAASIGRRARVDVGRELRESWPLPTARRRCTAGAARTRGRGRRSSSRPRRRDRAEARDAVPRPRGARVRVGESAVRVHLLGDHAEPFGVGRREQRQQRRLEHVDGRLHGVEDALAVDAGRERERERRVSAVAPLSESPSARQVPARRAATMRGEQRLVGRGTPTPRSRCGSGRGRAARRGARGSRRAASRSAAA